MKLKLKLKSINYKTYGLLTFLGLLMLIGAAIIVWGSYKMMDNNRKSITNEALYSIEQGNYARASYLLSEAYNAGDQLAIEYLAWLECRRGNYQRALLYANQSVQAGNVRSYQILGILSLLGYGHVPGADTAMKYFSYAIDPEIYPDSLSQQKVLSQMVDNALSYPNDEKEYYKLVEHGVKINAPKSILAMGDLFFLGENTDKSYPAALDYWLKANRLGVVESYNRLGGVYYNGLGTNRNVNRAIEYYKQGVAHNDPMSMFNLALILLKEQGTEHYKVAKELLERAAAQHLGEAYSLLGILKYTVEQDTPNYQKESADLFELAYEHRAPAGSVIYALMQIAGVGMDANYDLGMDCLYSLKEQGSLVAGELIRELTKGYNPQEMLRQVLFFVKKAIFAKDAYGKVNLNREEQVAFVGNANRTEVQNYTIEYKSNIVFLPMFGPMLIFRSPATGARHFYVTSIPPKPPAPPIPPGYREDPLVLQYGF